MSHSVLRQKLLTMRQLTFKAIYSDESRKSLGDLWIEVEDLFEKSSPQPKDREILAGLLHSHNTLATTMSKLESFHANLMSEAQKEMDLDDNCECLKRITNYAMCKLTLYHQLVSRSARIAEAPKSP